MNFNYVGNCDISEIKQKINELNESYWENHNIRQTLYRMHTNTQTIELIWDLESLNSKEKGKEHENLYILGIDKFLNTVKPLYYEKYGRGDFVRVLLVKLKKHTKIKPHVDSGIGLILSKRTHLAVITNDLVTFTVNNETKNLKEGEIWEINNQKQHSVENDSDMDRIHLIIDYMVHEIPNKLF